jgi:hypothetical protein
MRERCNYSKPAGDKLPSRTGLSLLVLAIGFIGIGVFCLFVPIELAIIWTQIIGAISSIALGSVFLVLAAMFL